MLPTSHNQAPDLPQETTPIMGIPVLTESEKTALVERPDHGITPANLMHFKDYEDWENRRLRIGSQFLGYFQGEDDGSPSIFNAYRELQCFQRLMVLQPDFVRMLRKRVSALSEAIPDEETNLLLMEAYEKMANLTDVNDQIPDGRDSEGGLKEGCLFK